MKIGRAVRVVGAIAAALVISMSVGGNASYADASGYQHLTAFTNLCLDASGSEESLPLTQATCKKVSNEEWTFKQVGTINDHRTGSCMCTYAAYNLINRGSGKCAEFPASTVSGTSALQGSCISGDQLQWWKIDGGIITSEHIALAFTSVAFTTLCLSTSGGSDGSPVVAKTCGADQTDIWVTTSF